MRDADRWDRLSPLAGVVFVVLTVISIVVTSKDSPSDFPGDAQEIVDYYVDNTGSIMAGSWIGFIGTLFFFWFAGALWSRLRAAEGRQGRVSAVAFAGAVAVGVIGLIIDATNLIPALRADEYDTIDPAYGSVLFDLQGAAVGAMLPVALAVMLGAAGTVAIRTGVLPAWFGIASLVLATGLLILPIAFFLTILGLVWVLVVSIWLFLRPALPAAGPGGAPPAETGRTTPA